MANGFPSASWQSDFARDVGRPRNNSRAVRFYYPFENSHRFTTSYQKSNIAGFSQMALTGFVETYEQRTDQDRLPTTTTGRNLERADVTADDFHVKESVERSIATTRIELGVDVNGRYNLEALDTIRTYDIAGSTPSDITYLSMEDAHRIGTGLFAQGEVAIEGLARLSGGIRGDRVITKNVGGFFGDRSTSNTAVSDSGAVSVQPFRGLSVVNAGIARVSRSGPVGPILSGALGSGIHHGQSRSRPGNKPSGRRRDALQPDADPLGGVLLPVSDQQSHRTDEPLVQAFMRSCRDRSRAPPLRSDTDGFLLLQESGTGTPARCRSRDTLGSWQGLLDRDWRAGHALDDGAHLDDIAPTTLSIFGRKNIRDGGYAFARVAWHAEDNRPGPSEVAAPDAILLDVGTGVQLLPRLQLRGLLRNLLNDHYYASPDARWVPAPDRSFIITAVALLSPPHQSAGAGAR